MAVYANLTVDQGATFSANIDVVDNDGDALDLNGYTVAGQLRKASKMHLAQAKKIEAHIKAMEKMAKKKK